MPGVVQFQLHISWLICSQKSSSTETAGAELFAPDPVSTQPHFDGRSAGNTEHFSASAYSKPVSSVMSSADLLKRMRVRNFASRADDTEPNDAEDSAMIASLSSADANPVHMELITDMRNFIAFGARVDGQASTDEILQEFRTRLPVEDTAKFKAILKQLCTLHKNVDGADKGQGIWFLRTEFR